LFKEYFFFGWNHIMSWAATDHILFIVALAAIYTIKNTKEVLVLITAFTIGHSITLVLSAFNLVKIPSRTIELLIPCTIIATAVFNLFQKKFTPASLRLNYVLALFFGLVHGLGFANGLKSLLGKTENIVLPLLGFNVGLEAGQIVVVLSILLVSWLFLNRLKVSREKWVVFLSGAAISVAVHIIIEQRINQ
jgi:hydrogenase/urease accessory protein HupE